MAPFRKKDVSAEEKQGPIPVGQIRRVRLSPLRNQMAGGPFGCMDTTAGAMQKLDVQAAFQRTAAGTWWGTTTGTETSATVSAKSSPLSWAPV